MFHFKFERGKTGPNLESKHFPFLFFFGLINLLEIFINRITSEQPRTISFLDSRSHVEMKESYFASFKFRGYHFDKELPNFKLIQNKKDKIHRRVDQK